MQETRRLKIKFANGDRDEIVELANDSHVSDLLCQLRERKKWSAEKNIRIIAAGKEISSNAAICSIQEDNLHCSVSDYAPSKARQSLSDTTPTSNDWLDRINPGVMLMWIVGTVLLWLWMLLFLQKNLFDTPSVGLLALVTLAFLFPCFSFYFSDSNLAQNASSTEFTPTAFSSESPMPPVSYQGNQSPAYGYQVSASSQPQFRNVSTSNSQSAS